ncbi:MAG: hypothetical protein V4684_15765 [Pseudomonadota bacterium]
MTAFEPDAVLARPKSPREIARAQSVANVAQAANARLASRPLLPARPAEDLLAEEPYLGSAAADELDPHPQTHPGEGEGISETKHESRPVLTDRKPGGEIPEAAPGKLSAAQAWQAKHGSRAGQRALKPRIQEQPMSDTQSQSSQGSQGSQGKDKGGASPSQPPNAEMTLINLAENRRKQSLLSNPGSVGSGSMSSATEGLRVPPQPMRRSASGSQLPDFSVRPILTSKRIAPLPPEDARNLRWSMPVAVDAYGGETFGETVPAFDKWMSIPGAREQVIEVLRRGHIYEETGTFLSRCDDFKNAPREQRYAVLATIIAEHLTDGAPLQITVQGHELEPLLAEFGRTIPHSSLRFDSDLAKAFRGVRNNAVGLIHNLVSRDPGGAHRKILQIVEDHDAEKAAAARQGMVALFNARQVQPPKDKESS